MRDTAASILVFLRYIEQESDIESIIGDCQVLWSGRIGFEWIGDGDKEWDSVFLLKYRNFSEYQRAIDRFRMENFKQIKLFAVKPRSSSKIRFYRFLMKFIFSRSTVDFSDVDVNLDDFPQSKILPTKEQHIRLANEDKGKPVVMLNLLTYFEQPSYPPDYEGKRCRNGEDAYNQYGKHAMRAVAKLGGFIEAMGDVESILIGEDNEKWDQFALMRYPSHDAVQSMFKLRGPPEAAIHRDAGLEATKVYALTPVK